MTPDAVTSRSVAPRSMTRPSRVNRSQTVVLTKRESGRRLELAALGGEVVQCPSRQREVEPVRAAVGVIVHAPARTVARDAVAQEGLGIGAGLERERGEESVAEPDVDNPGTVEHDDQHEMVALRAPPALRAPHGARDVAHVEAQRLEDVSEQAVHLVAPAAAPFVDELGEDASGVERQRRAEVNIEVLIGNRQQVSAVEAAEGGQRRAWCHRCSRCARSSGRVLRARAVCACV